MRSFLHTTAATRAGREDRRDMAGMSQLRNPGSPAPRLLVLPVPGASTGLSSSIPGGCCAQVPVGCERQGFQTAISSHGWYAEMPCRAAARRCCA
jgi:hypothetical protein